VVDVPIGESKREFAGADLRTLIERAMAEQTGADFGLMNQGGVRAKLPQGPLLARHVWNVMPFDNKVVTGKFKGSELPPVVAQVHAVDPNREYTLSTIDFLVDTGGMGTRGLSFSQTGPLLRDIMIDWIKKKQVIE
jgi:2',3'-cyclic-nucleotide 2'-phosphodiesterase (5'-nucleotidase family)